jgi:beta-lactamase regulating signal transducer with metallopeptidase domain
MLLEAAARSLAMGAAIFVLLHLFKIHAVKAQRAAWILALVGALAMPLAVYFDVGPKILPAAHTVQPSAQIEAPLPAVVVHRSEASSMPRVQVTPAAPRAAREFSLKALATDVYVFVAVTFFVRLVMGLVLSLRLVGKAKKIELPGLSGRDIRVSRDVRSPVTVASTVLLPESHVRWDDSARNVIVSHELSHVERKDFWIQVLASAHLAVFWFSPLSFWLKAQLASLAEAQSDLAGIDAAKSRQGYAELLLAIADGTEPLSVPSLAVAMARPSRLGGRIERILSETLFARAFAAGRRSLLAASALALMALVAATSVRQADAALATSSTTPPAPPVPQAPAPDPVTPPAPASPLSAPKAPKAPKPMKPHASYHFVSSDINGSGVLAIHTDDDYYSLDEGAGEQISIQRSTPDDRAGGDYIYYRQSGGELYLVKDPQILAKAKELLAPVKELSRRQSVLGDMQQKLGDEQAQLGERQAASYKHDPNARVTSPDFRNDYAALDQAIADLKSASQGAKTQQDLIRLQEKLGTLQGHLGAMEGKLASEEAHFDSLDGERMAKLGEEQAKLGEQQAKLGEEQGKLGEEHVRRMLEACNQLKPLIEKAIQSGALKPVT